jgi:carbamoyltransferase
LLILGVNAYHGDASAALFVDGSVVAAVEEERFTRLKHQAGFPAKAIAWCLETAGVRPDQLDHVAISRNPLAHVERKIAAALRRRPSLSFVRQRAANAKHITGVREALAASLDIDPARLRARYHRVEHHRTHLASAFFCSPYESATCASFDGMGDFVSAMWAEGRGNTMRVRGYVPFPDSLGVFYTAFTQFLGLPQYGDEYKLMGLAAYGQPRYLEALRSVLTLERNIGFKLNLDYFVHHQFGVSMTWEAGTPSLSNLFSARMAEVFGPPRQVGGEVTERDCDLASSVQARLEEVELELLRRLYRRWPQQRLVLAGGVALNCLVNGKIRLETPFEDVWIQPAANDAGTSIGAALWVWNQVLGQPRNWRMNHAYLGPAYDQPACDRAAAEAGLTGCHFSGRELTEHVAARIDDGAVVGWYQGPTEFGPRALGNRSIICDPRRADMKDILNARIKHREPFRPFAPAVLAEHTSEWFEQGYPSPFMLMAYKVRPERRAAIPAVTHQDGTGRLQTVTRDSNPAYYDLIAAFARRTGVPVVLNTSLNENEPIVCTPHEAVECFLRTKLDVLVLGELVIDRQAAG